MHCVHNKQKSLLGLVVYLLGSQGLQSNAGSFPQRFTKRFPVIKSTYKRFDKTSLNMTIHCKFILYNVMKRSQPQKYTRLSDADSLSNEVKNVKTDIL